jgi:hypothetical protein
MWKGRGTGGTKSIAKQWAARCALESLMPGVVIDDETGILVSLPESASIEAHAKSDSVCEAEDLAPNLAKRLAIDKGDDDDDDDKSQSTNNTGGFFRAGRESDSQGWQKRSTSKRAWEVYPGTSTTSDDDELAEKNKYYSSSRGASVFSALLSAIAQMDRRIVGPPEYTYEQHALQGGQTQGWPASASSETGLASNQNESKGRALSSPSSKPFLVRVHRASFVCRAQLKLRVRGRDDSVERASLSEDDIPEQVYAEARAKKDDDEEDEDDHARDAEQAVQSVQVLEAQGIGATKREARHVASSKLLTLLFPECETMVEVKAAAEAFREAYSTKKALRSMQGSSLSECSIEGDSDTRQDRSSRALSLKTELMGGSSLCPSSPPLNEIYVQGLSQLLATDNQAQATLKAGVQGSNRNKQIDEIIDRALQSINERDEEGRTLPEELTADDVGRTILRRAEDYDLERVKKLLNDCDRTHALSQRLHRSDTKLTRSSSSPIQRVGYGGINTVRKKLSDRAVEVLLNQSIVMLLCRAIAAYEDPPLGCAVLSIGFSMQHGRTLIVNRIGMESHLPQERFVECLQCFAASMECTLEYSSPSASVSASSLSPQQPSLRWSGVSLKVPEVVEILQSHIAHAKSDRGNEASSAKSEAVLQRSGRLQSVREESEVSESSSVENKRVTKVRSKPKSKRSRVY